jgi:SPP1 family predicted phage head-tail adaptor
MPELNFDPGRLDQKVTIQTRSASLDAYGQQVNTWSDLLTVWANLRPLGGSEKLRALAMASQLSHTVLVRYNPAFMPPTTADAWRIKFGTRYFNIQAARNVDEANHWIIFDCTEGSNDGQ